MSQRAPVGLGPSGTRCPAQAVYRNGIPPPVEHRNDTEYNPDATRIAMKGVLR
jgi:hypothetical protein